MSYLADPTNMWTCISGFVEHGESVEAAAMREVAEETNVQCDWVSLVASQPWPLGRGDHCELMLACVGKAKEGSDGIDVTHADGGAELEAARWFTRAEVLSMLERQAPDSHPWVPASYAIAHHIIERWAKGLLRMRL